MTNRNGNPLRDVIQSRSATESGNASRRIVTFGILGIAALGVYAVLAASVDLGGTIGRASDVVAVPSCNDGTEISLDHEVDATGETLVSSVHVTGINPRCDGAPVALVFVDAAGAIVDEIVWVLELQPGDSSITAVANGSDVSTSNASTSNVSVSYPSSQSDPEGLSSSLVASSIFGVTLIDLASERAARE